MLSTLSSYTGWLADITSENALVDVEILPAPDSGEAAMIEVGGIQQRLLIQSVVAGHLPGAVVFAVAGIKSVPAVEPPRQRVDQMTFELDGPNGVVHGMVNDISELGLGLTCSADLVVNKEYRIRISTPLGETAGIFTVRHSLRSGKFENRTGGLFRVEDRVDQARWRTLVQKKMAA